MQAHKISHKRDLVTFLREQGFSLASTKGRHEKWSHPDGRRITVPHTVKGPLDIRMLRVITTPRGAR